MSAVSWAGNPGVCTNADSFDRWGATELIIIRDWVPEYRALFANPNVQLFSCVKSSSGPNGGLNHLEFRISQNQIELWGTDAGETALRLMTRWSNVNLSATRGLVWLEDAHYNAEKGSCEVRSGLPCQSQHTFTWDNLAFDGPFTYRDFSYDALDAMNPRSDGSVNLGKSSGPNQTTSWNVLNMPSNPQAAAARVLFNFSSDNPVNNFIVTVNGHQHPTASPLANSSLAPSGWKTLSVTIPVTDLVAGTNVVQVGSVDQGMIVSNVNIVLVDAPGGVPVLPGSNNAYPATVR